MHKLFLPLISLFIAGSVFAGSAQPSVSDAMKIFQHTEMLNDGMLSQVVASANLHWEKQNFNQAIIAAMRDSAPYKQSAMTFALSNPAAYRYVFDEISYEQHETFFNALLASQQAIISNQQLILKTLLSDKKNNNGSHKKGEVGL